MESVPSIILKDRLVDQWALDGVLFCDFSPMCSLVNESAYFSSLAEALTYLVLSLTLVIWAEFIIKSGSNHSYLIASIKSHKRLKWDPKPSSPHSGLCGIFEPHARTCSYKSGKKTLNLISNPRVVMRFIVKLVHPSLIVALVVTQ